MILRRQIKMTKIKYEKNRQSKSKFIINKLLVMTINRESKMEE